MGKEGKQERKEIEGAKKIVSFLIFLCGSVHLYKSLCEDMYRVNILILSPCCYEVVFLYELRVHISVMLEVQKLQMFS